MKLAEALVLRADLKKQIEQIKLRIIKNAKVQEGDEPAEDPNELFKQFNSVLDEFGSIVKRIDKTNFLTKSDEDKSLAENLIERDSIGIKRNALLAIIEAGSIRADRYSRTEIKSVSTVNIKELQKEVDFLAKVFRETDTKIQQLNWNTDLIN